jgi:hypothetical protein
LEYSEKKFNEHSVSNLKTLIIKYDYFDFSEMYDMEIKKKGNIELSRQPTSHIVSSYGSHLIYFDMVKKERIGFDVMPGPELPSQVSKSVSQEFNHTISIVRQIETHIVSSAK